MIYIGRIAGWLCVAFLTVLLIFPINFSGNLALGQGKPKKLSHDQVDRLVQQELEKFRVEASSWHEKYNAEREAGARQYDSRVIAETQLKELKAILFKLSK